MRYSPNRAWQANPHRRHRTVSPQKMETQFNQSLQPTCYPYDCSTVTEDGKWADGSSRHRVARTRLNSALSCHSVFHLDEINVLPVMKPVTAPLDVPRAANPVGRTAVNEVVNGAVNRSWCGCSERSHARWQTFRRSRCRNKLPVGGRFGTAGTRLPLRWKANCRFRCQNKFPVGGRTAAQLPKQT